MTSPQSLFFLRFKALVIDVFMIYTPILYLMTYVVLGGKEAFQHNQFAIFICFLLYAGVDSLLCAKFKQTPGMKAQNLILKTMDGKDVGFLLAFVRFMLFCLSFALLFGFVFPFLRKDKQTFHDLICHTKVVLT